MIPYALIYLAKDKENWVYWGALIVSVIFVIGSTLFVQACYPSTKVCMVVYAIVYIFIMYGMYGVSFSYAIVGLD